VSLSFVLTDPRKFDQNCWKSSLVGVSLQENLSVTGGIAVWSIAFVRSTITDARHTPIITNIETPTMRGMERGIDVQISAQRLS